MSSHLMSEIYRSTYFVGTDLPELLLEVHNWLVTVNPSGRNNNFYFVDMTYSYDGESGATITVWHGEIE